MECSIFSYHTFYVLKSHSVCAADLLFSLHVSIMGNKTSFLLLYQCLKLFVYQPLQYCTIRMSKSQHPVPLTFFSIAHLPQISFPSLQWSPSDFLLQLQHQLLPLKKAKTLDIMTHTLCMWKFCHLIHTIPTTINLQLSVKTQEQTFIENTLKYVILHLNIRSNSFVP